MTEPPSIIVSTAAHCALKSPCAKSKRGVVIYRPGMIIGLGWNGPPVERDLVTQKAGLECDGERCRSVCRQVAVHAEERAVRSIGREPVTISREATRRIAGVGVGGDRGTHLVHVKIEPEHDDDRLREHGPRVVAGGPPSCVTCSRTILDSNLVDYVWLLEAQNWHDNLRCESCGTITMVQKDEGSTMVCSNCVGGLLRFETTTYARTGVWKRYTAAEFHRATLTTLGLYGGAR